MAETYSRKRGPSDREAFENAVPLLLSSALRGLRPCQGGMAHARAAREASVPSASPQEGPARAQVEGSDKSGQCLNRSCAGDEAVDLGQVTQPARALLLPPMKRE